MGVLFFEVSLHAQPGQNNEPVKLIFAETVTDYKKQPNTSRAVGNVQFQHTNTKLFCDSAIFFHTTNIVFAYGRVQINKGDTVNLFCDSLVYDGTTNISKLRGHVRFRDNEYKLVTDSLDYDANKSLGYYTNNAVITSITDDLKLTSRKGYYYSNTKVFFFRDSVHVTDEGYELFSDTLEFRTIGASAHFHGPTLVLMDSMELHCNKGIYFTEDKLIRLWEGASIYETSRIFSADSLVYDQIADIGQGFCHVSVYDSLERILFLSDYLLKKKGDTEFILRDNAHVAQFNDNDTLFLSADTIYHYRDTIHDWNKSIAVSMVEIISGDILVACDSAYFSEQDSILKLNKHPLMWSKETQISGDSIHAVFYDDAFHLLDVYSNGFITTQQDTQFYDQIKGEYIRAFIDSSQIQKVNITSNAQTIYYLSETSTDSLGLEIKTIQGQNKIDCNVIVVYFQDSEISHITFIEQPEGGYNAIENVMNSELFLKGFLWQYGRKPKQILLE